MKRSKNLFLYTCATFWMLFLMGIAVYIAFSPEHVDALATVLVGIFDGFFTSIPEKYRWLCIISTVFATVWSYIYYCEITREKKGITK